MVQLSSDRFAKYLMRGYTRRGLAVVAGLLVAWKLFIAGWPWWTWVPAAILAVELIYALTLVGVYAYQKATYQVRARIMKEKLRQARDSADADEAPTRSSNG